MGIATADSIIINGAFWSDLTTAKLYSQSYLAKSPRAISQISDRRGSMRTTPVRTDMADPRQFPWADLSSVMLRCPHNLPEGAVPLETDREPIA